MVTECEWELVKSFWNKKDEPKFRYSGLECASFDGEDEGNKREEGKELGGLLRDVVITSR